MKFTIERRALVRMVDLVRANMPGRQKADTDLKLWVCAARVFASSGGTVAGYEALVFEDGECSVPGRHFSRILKSYSGKKNLTIEADQTGLRIGSFTMPVSHYSPHAEPPGEFRVFPVTDINVLLPNRKQPPVP